MGWRVGWNANNKHSNTMKEEIYKVGDRVYDAVPQQWGEVIRVDSHGLPITVIFDDGEVHGYTEDGRYISDGPCRLSFTYYDFENGGFSQERPKELPKKGQLVYVRDDDEDHWQMRFFSHYDEEVGRFYCFRFYYFRGQKNEGGTVPWKYCETENPLLSIENP